MDESFSPVILIYGLAIVLGVGKACTLLIWRTLARPRPGLRQELRVPGSVAPSERPSRRGKIISPLTRPQAPTRAATQDGLPRP
ncbi:hypothetical protein ACFQY9_34210 [Microvirga aerilata]|uniref:hypothetical protein n=1 Tax=Microvirga aerilata TaxID=670292 RepID=UPI00364402B7